MVSEKLKLQQQLFKISACMSGLLHVEVVTTSSKLAFVTSFFFLCIVQYWTHMQSSWLRISFSFASCPQEQYRRKYPKVSGLAAWSENCKWYSSLPRDAFVSLFCESF